MVTTVSRNSVLQIIGNLIYYRYINSAIVAPDAFDIIDVGAAKGLTNDQRRNLGSIAKILQFAASNKGASYIVLCVDCFDCKLLSEACLL
jgi:GTPase-activator protein for Ras-like GTPase